MKKIMTIFGAILFASFILTSCGPSAKECHENFYELSPSDQEKCLQRIIDDMD